VGKRYMLSMIAMYLLRKRLYGGEKGNICNAQCESPMRRNGDINIAMSKMNLLHQLLALSAVSGSVDHRNDSNV
jgi:hypothetical protein